MSEKSIYGAMDAATIKRFKHWQLRTIIVSMIGYAVYYFVRKNFSLAMPGLTAEYGISNTSFGIVIGIAAVVAIMEIGEGSKKQVADKFSSMGTNVVTISGASVSTAALFIAKSNFSIGVNYTTI